MKKKKEKINENINKKKNVEKKHAFNSDSMR